MRLDCSVQSSGFCQSSQDLVPGQDLKLASRQSVHRPPRRIRTWPRSVSTSAGFSTRAPSSEYVREASMRCHFKPIRSWAFQILKTTSVGIGSTPSINTVPFVITTRLTSPIVPSARLKPIATSRRIGQPSERLEIASHLTMVDRSRKIDTVSARTMTASPPKTHKVSSVRGRIILRFLSRSRFGDVASSYPTSRRHPPPRATFRAWRINVPNLYRNFDSIRYKIRLNSPG